MPAFREFSAGGVVLRERDGVVEIAVIKPAGRNTTALPKGHIDQGENAEQAARREVHEETGLQVETLGRLGDVKYVYRFGGKTIFKTVTFFLFRYLAGQIDEITQAMRKEVDRAWWMALDEAPRRLSYPGEREMAGRAVRGEKAKAPAVTPASASKPTS